MEGITEKFNSQKWNQELRGGRVKQSAADSERAILVNRVGENRRAASGKLETKSIPKAPLPLCFL